MKWTPEKQEEYKAERQERIKKFEGKSLVQLHPVYKDMRVEKAKLEAELKEINKDLGVCEIVLIGLMKSNEEKSKKMDDNVNYIRGIEYGYRADDPIAFKEWVTENAPELLSVNAMTMQSFCRKAEEGGPLPPGISVTDPYDTLTVRGLPKED